jgi:hypothetical protein
VLIRNTICATLVLAATACGASKREVHRAQTSGYNADFAVVYTQTLATVTDLYPHLVENPSAGVIKTAWHQIRIRQSGDPSSGDNTISNPGNISGNNPGGALERTASNHPGGTLYFIRFTVYVLGGRPWRVRIEGEAAEWEAGMKQSILKGAERPAWLRGRTEALQVAIYRRLKKNAVRIDSKKKRRAGADKKKPKLDPKAYGDIPGDATARVHALRAALRVGDFAKVRTFLIDEFVWSAGGAPSAEQAVIMWQADPTLASRLVAALEAGCLHSKDTAETLTCPAESRAGALRATFVKTGDAWMLGWAVAPQMARSSPP